MIRRIKSQKSKFKVVISNFKSEWGWVLGEGTGILIIFFILRLFNLTILPIFADEAIYIRWSQVMKAEPTLRFLPLLDGKQPLFMWFLMFFLGIFRDPLFAGRFLSVLSGFGSLVGIFLLSYELLKEKRVSLIASLFYTVIPFFVFFDRMALVDSLLSTLGIWVFYFGILLVRTLRLDLAMITGMILGSALITKSPALFFAILLPTTLFVSQWLDLKKRKKTGRRLIKLGGLLSVVYVFGFGIYNLLRLGPNFQMIAIRNKDYVYSFKEIISHPLDPLGSHLFDLASWLPNLVTLPILLLAVAGLVLMWKEKDSWREGIWLFLISGFPLFIQVVFAKVFTPRYILFCIWPLIIFASYFLDRMLKSFIISHQNKIRFNELILLFFIFIILIPSFYCDYFLLTFPEKAPLPRKMRSGYLEEWTAGQGIREIADYIKEEAKTKKIFVGTEGFFGTLPDGLQVYLEKVANVTIVGVGYPISEIHSSLINSLTDNEVYLVVNQSRFLISPETHGLKLVREYPKAVTPQGNYDKLLFFQLDKNFWLK